MSVAEMPTDHHTYHRGSVSVVHERGRGIAWRIWPGAHVLIDWLEKHKSEWDMSTVVEIGAGVGLVGIVCAQFAQQVVLTDLPEELPALVRSVESNCLDIQEKLCVRPLGFGDVEMARSVAAQSTRKSLVIVGSELIYWESLFEPIAQTLKTFIYEFGAVCYIGYRIRVWKTEKRFFTKILSQFGLEAEVVGQWRAVETDTGSQLSEGLVRIEEEGEWNTRVYRILKKKISPLNPLDAEIWKAPEVYVDARNESPTPTPKKKTAKIPKKERKGRVR